MTHRVRDRDRFYRFKICIMSLTKSMCGRKRECGVWAYFEFLANKNESQCKVRDVKTGTECKQVFKGKNPTNLKKHLQAIHKDTFDEMTTSDAVRIASKKRLCLTSATITSAGSSTQTLMQCLNRKAFHWGSTSLEHKQRQNALIDVFVDTAYPVTMVNNIKFKQFCTAMDPKFRCPGMYDLYACLLYYLFFF